MQTLSNSLLFVFKGRIQIPCLGWSWTCQAPESLSLSFPKGCNSRDTPSHPAQCANCHKVLQSTLSSRGALLLESLSMEATHPVEYTYQSKMDWWMDRWGGLIKHKLWVLGSRWQVHGQSLCIRYALFTYKIHFCTCICRYLDQIIHTYTYIWSVVVLQMNKQSSTRTTYWVL